MKWIFGIIINAVLFVALAGYFKDSFYIEGIPAALAASVVFSLVNMFVKPVLILLTLPITVLTIGAFLLVINAITLVLTDSIVGSSFEIEGFGMAFLISIIISFVNLVIQQTVFQKDNDKKRRD